MDKKNYAILVGMVITPDENNRHGYQLHGGITVPSLIDTVYLAKELSDKIEDPKQHFLHELSNFAASLIYSVELDLLDLLPDYLSEGKAACPWILHLHVPGAVDLWRQEILDSVALRKVAPVVLVERFPVDPVVVTSGSELNLSDALSEHVICPPRGKAFHCGHVAEDLSQLISGIEKNALNGKGGA